MVTIISRGANAATPTLSPTLSPTESEQNSQIERIKDLVASKVAELKLVDKRGIVGTVKTSTNNQITLLINERQRLADIDELTKFESASSDKTFGISDVNPGDVLSLIGLYNKDSERLLARFVSLATAIPQNTEGVVVEKNKTDFTLTVMDGNGKRNVVNVETSTKTSSYDEDSTIRSGFSKVLPGERIIVVGFRDKTNENEINASRILHFPSLALSADQKKSKDLFDLEVQGSTESAR